MSLFALSVNDNVLQVLSDETQLRALCLPAEVAAQAWLFFADDGSALRAQPNLDGGPDYFLRPWASCSSCSLPQVLPFVTAVRGAGLASVAEVAAHIKTTERRQT